MCIHNKFDCDKRTDSNETSRNGGGAVVEKNDTVGINLPLLNVSSIQMYHFTGN